MAASQASIQQVFESFCAFGAKDSTPMMDNVKFAKFFRDLKLLDKKVSATDVDIIFSKVKRKTDRKINFEQFQDGVKQIAEKKYPGDPNGLRKLESKINEGKGPKAVGVTETVDSPIVDRMTDTKKYTGSHKERFDETGKGKGLAGRDSVLKGAGMNPGSISSGAGYVQGYKHEGTYEKKVKGQK